MKLTKFSSDEHYAAYRYFNPETFMQLFNDFLRSENISSFLGGEFDTCSVAEEEAFTFERMPYCFSYLNTCKGVALTIFATDKEALSALREQFTKYLQAKNLI
jgi:hypothetical protein